MINKLKYRETDGMKWYVLCHEFNHDQIELFNIFDSYYFSENIKKALKKYVDFETFKKEVETALSYSFMSKSECEIIVSGLFPRDDNSFKIDIYDQVILNLDILAKYIIEEYNKKKRKKLIV